MNLVNYLVKLGAKPLVLYKRLYPVILLLPLCTVSLTSTKSSANSIAQGGLVLAFSANTSMITMRRHGLSQIPGVTPLSRQSTPESFHILSSRYMSCITFKYPSGIDLFLVAHHIKYNIYINLRRSRDCLCVCACVRMCVGVLAI